MTIRRTMSSLSFGLIGLIAMHFDAPRLLAAGHLEISVIDRDTGQPIACRMHLTNSAGRALKAGQAPFWTDHFVFSGKLSLTLPKGSYSFEMERGPEYLTRTGHFTIDDFADDAKVIDMKRFVDLAKDGWWSGDLDVRRPLTDIELLMQADDLHLAQVVSSTSDKSPGPVDKRPGPRSTTFDANRCYSSLARADARAGGALLLFGLARRDATAALPSLASVAADSRGAGAWLDIARADSWDLPILLALGAVDSIQLADDRMCRDRMIAGAGGRPNAHAANTPAAIGEWSQDIYYHLLNCGLRIPPSAASGSGSAPNPVGYNRVYVHIDGEFSDEKWWEGLRAGRAFVTNGPLIRTKVEGHPPGHVFHADSGGMVELEIGLELSTRDKIAYLEIIRDGRVVHTEPLERWARSGGKLPPLKFEQSGWFLVRAVTDNPKTYRFASSGAYYVEVDYQPRISRRSVQFFLNWIDERAEKLTADDPVRRQTLELERSQARKFWQDLLTKANAE